MKTIIIESIPHSKQRYPTLGDYFEEMSDIYSEGNLKGHEKITAIKVSDMGNEDAEFLIGIHELVESYLCRKRGIKEEDITAFDIAFEEKNIDEEPGDQPDAPYRNEHRVATIIEQILCHELGWHWCDYEKFLIDFYDKNTPKELSTTEK